MTLVYNRSVTRHVLPENLKERYCEDVDIKEALDNLIKLSKKYPTNTPNKGELDLVYIVRPGEQNIDLRYSLRSISKFCTFRSVYIVGFKPFWVQNINFIPTIQSADKWKNSMLNYITACNSEKISNNFILMNDDFFAIRPVIDWNHDCNVCLGKLEDFAEKFSTNQKISRWQHGFEYAIDLLNSVGCSNHYNYEAHTPIIINKHNFLATLNQSDIKAFQDTNKVFHKRSIYKNLYPDDHIPRIIKDVKLDLYKDIDLSYLEENWISTYDNTLNNNIYPLVNKLLKGMFNKPCKFEKVL